MPEHCTRENLSKRSKRRSTRTENARRNKRRKRVMPRNSLCLPVESLNLVRKPKMIRMCQMQRQPLIKRRRIRMVSHQLIPLQIWNYYIK